ncbi:MAG: VWA domain-containing protein [Phycisphaerales bacterium]|nr:VWA domain-containing protein [Phycisphaerales bacterium]
MRALNGKTQLLPRQAKLALLGLAISLPFHFLLVVILATVRVPLPTAVGAGELLEIQLTPLERMTPRASPDLAQDPISTTPSIEAASTTEATARSLPVVTEVTSQSVLGSGLARPGDIEGNRAGSGASRPGARADFFGVVGTGKRIAYLMDKSGSMRDGGRMEAARKELIRSIEELPDFAEVCVVFFDDEKSVWPAHPCFVRMSHRNREALLEWISQVSPSGGTNPLPAYIHVMRCEQTPDLVYLLSDGEIPLESLLGIVAEHGTSKGAAVNTFAFGGQAEAETLRRLAAECGGSFNAVSGGAGR